MFALPSENWVPNDVITSNRIIKGYMLHGFSPALVFVSRVSQSMGLLGTLFTGGGSPSVLVWLQTPTRYRVGGRDTGRANMNPTTS